MKFCPKCGWQMADDENYCRNCGTKVESAAYSNATNYNTATNSSPFDEVPARRINKVMAVFIKIFLILVLMSIAFNVIDCLVVGITLESLSDLEGIIGEAIVDVDYSGVDVNQLVKLIKNMYIVAGVLSLVPLIWVLPMSKKIFKAINEGTTLTTGFKVCTLLFVNLVAGILLLCSNDI